MENDVEQTVYEGRVIVTYEEYPQFIKWYFKREPVRFLEIKDTRDTRTVIDKKTKEMVAQIFCNRRDNNLHLIFDKFYEEWKMIPERNMNQGKQVHNSNKVKWYLTIDPCGVHCIMTPKKNTLHDFDYYEIDPSTVEDVPVKLKDKYYCPNCGAFFHMVELAERMNSANVSINAEKTPYCGNCGQRLDWCGEDEN